jgi:hypothetical protein
MTRKLIIAVAMLALIPLASVTAKPKKPLPRPEAFEALVRCRAIQTDAERLQCFDRAAGDLQEAAERRDVVMVDRKTIRETKRSLFGLDIPNLNPFGDDDSDEPEIKSVEGVVAAAFTDGNGRWVVRLQDGGTWGQTDNTPLALRPRPGHKVKINRGAIGSYMMRVNGQPAIRVKRQI